MHKLRGRVVVVTGAAQRIGAAIAREFSKESASSACHRSRPRRRMVPPERFAPLPKRLISPATFTAS